MAYTVWNSVADEPMALLGCGSFPWSGHCRNYIQCHCSVFYAVPDDRLKNLTINIRFSVLEGVDTLVYRY
jgi:hypothetical protein